jgi:hypothetical protein
MNRALLNSTHAPSLVIRVLDGLEPRESSALDMRKPVLIGHAFSNDVVLRDPTVRGNQVQLLLGCEVAELTVLEGEAVLLGCRLAAPARVMLQPYLPLILGEVAVAFGEPSSGRWTEAEQLLAAIRTEAPSPSAQFKSKPVTRWDKSASWLRGRGRRLHVGMSNLAVPVLILAAVGLLALAGEGAAIGLRPAHPPQALQQILRQAGFPGLTVSRAPDGRDLVGGRLADAAARDRLLNVLNGRHVPFRLIATTNDDLARQTEDIFQTGGVAATVRPAGGDHFVAAVGRGEDPARLDLLRRRALKDIGGIGELSVITNEVDLRPDENSDRPGKKIAYIAGGRDGYVSTIDGSRYFIGSTLPTGQTITMITTSDVFLQKDGEQSKLAF